MRILYATNASPDQVKAALTASVLRKPNDMGVSLNHLGWHPHNGLWLCGGGFPKVLAIQLSHSQPDYTESVRIFQVLLFLHEFSELVVV